MLRLLSPAALFLSLLALGAQSTSVAAAEIKADKTDGGTVIISVFGEIKTGDDVKFRRLSIENKDAIVILDSAGGQLMPALEIGKIIRLAGYSTMVGDEFVCTSSCALIWLAGSPRYLEPGGKVGFHASYRDNQGRMEETGVGNAVIGHYLSLLNLPQRAVVFATTASPKEILWLTSANSRQSGIDFQSIGESSNSLAQAKTKSVPAMRADTAPPTIRTVTPPPLIRTVMTPPPLVRTVTAPRQARANITLADLQTIIRQRFQDPSYLQTLFGSMDISADGRATLIDHARILYADKRYTDRLALELYQAREGFSGGDGDRAIGMSIGQATSVKLSLNGLSRLPDNDVNRYLSYITSMISNASDAECNAVLSGKDASGKIEMRLWTEIGKENHANYLALTRRAIMAELNAYPAKMAPSKDEVAAGKKSFENHLTQELSKLPKADQDRILRAMASLDDANDKDSCDGYYMIFRTAVELGGMPGNWQRRDMVNGMAQ